MERKRKSVFWPEDGDQAFCLDCGKWVTATEMDFGIGPYEFWGERGYHHDYRIVCPLCESGNFCDDPVQCSKCGAWLSEALADQYETGEYVCQECTPEA